MSGITMLPHWLDDGSRLYTKNAARSVWLTDDQHYTGGNTAATPDWSLGWNTAQTVDALFLGLPAAQNVFVIAERADAAFDFAHGAQINPTVFIHSAVQATTQWLGLAHNQTDAVITAGLGVIILDAPSGIVLRDGAITSLEATTDGVDALWTAAGGDNINIEVNGNATLILQQATFTPAATHTAVDIRPTWASENFTHQALRIIAAQNGANTLPLRSLVISADKITDATTLAEMTFVRLFGGAIDGTVTTLRGIQIANLGNSNATSNFPIDIEAQSGSATNRAIRIVGTGAANAIELGDSPLLYSSGAEVIRFDDSTAARGISFTLTAAGVQTIGTSAGNLSLSPTSANVATTANVDFDMSAGGRFFGGGVQINSQTLGANTNLTMDENDGHIDITTGAVSNNTITLPAASGNQGMLVSFYLEVDGGFDAVITRAGADVIQNGAADLANTTVTLDTVGEYLMLQCVSSTMWQVVVNSGGVVA